MALAEQSLLLVGRMGRAHGVRGEVKVIPETDDPRRLSELERLYIGDDPASAVSYSLRSVRFQHARKGLTVLVAFEGINDRETVDRFRSKGVYAAREDLPPLDEEEFFVHDLIGCSVFEENGAFIGTLHEVLEMPAHDVYVVERAGRTDALIPAVPAFIEDVDVDAKRIVIRSIEGLLDG